MKKLLLPLLIFTNIAISSDIKLSDLDLKSLQESESSYVLFFEHIKTGKEMYIANFNSDINADQNHLFCTMSARTMNKMIKVKERLHKKKMGTVFYCKKGEYKIPSFNQL
jgi:hypothetical protein